MPAARTFQAEVRAYPQDFPFFASAWMRLFHRDDVSHIKSVCHSFCSFPECLSYAALAAGLMFLAAGSRLIYRSQYALHEESLVIPDIGTGRQAYDLRLCIQLHIYRVIG